MKRRMECWKASLALVALSASPTARSADLPLDVTAWLRTRVATSQAYLARNISPLLPGYLRGFVVAAPWTVPGVQDYRYHWVRDAALVMNTQITCYIGAHDAAQGAEFFAKIRDYLNFSKLNQNAYEPPTTEPVGLGEVKFNPDGTRFTAWMRPQNDGPALRAITVIRFLRRQGALGDTGLVHHLYDGSAPGSRGVHAPALLRTDLDYVAAHWTDVGFDPWEEVKGHHFYTRIVQRKALLDGARLAADLGDAGSARTYMSAARRLEAALAAHWLPPGAPTPAGQVSSGQIWDSFDRVAGPDYKISGLDVATVLGALHAYNELDAPGDHFFSPSDDQVLRTAYLLTRAFRQAFPVAARGGPYDGTPIGRYPYDRYNGYDSTTQGNPWYLATAAFAELYYRCAEEWAARGRVAVNAVNAGFLATLLAAPLRIGETIGAGDPRFGALIGAVHALGDTYLRQIAIHEGPQGHLTEEFSRDDGAPRGAQDLSWSYASILTAAAHR